MADLKELRKNSDIRFSQMLADRRDFEGWWRKLSEQFSPNRGRFRPDEQPVKTALRYNSRARQIPDDFAAGMKSGLTSPSRAWFTLTLYDNGLAELENVKAWLTEVQDIMQGSMLRTNLYDQLFDVYKEEGIFGTAALLIEEDDEDIFRAQSLTIGSYCVGVDKRGHINRFGRQFRRTLTQLAAEFGEENLPRELRYKLKDRPDNTRYELRNLIQPSEEYLQSEGKQGKFKFSSLWWLVGYNDPEFLRIGGYHEIPVMCPRWRVINDDLYGREQPGDIGYDDAVTLQELELDERSAIKKGVRPPVAMPESLTEGDLRDYPGGVTIYNPISEGVPAITPLYQVQFDHRSVAEKRLELTQHLEQIFHVDMFKMWTADLRANRTATEIQAREQEKMFMLGSLIERQMSELLDPMINRIFAIMNRAGKIPPPPEELQDREVKIEYMSILANIQKQAAYSGITTLLGEVGRLAELQAATGGRPDVLDKIDCDEIVDQLADMYIVPAGIVLGDDAVEELRQARKEAEAQAQQQQQMMQEAQMAAQAAPQVTGAMKDLSEIPNQDGGNGLESLAGMLGGVQQGA
ncbi:MAG: head-tail connector protein [Synergistaceae bacterium]|nr:head-tail connector protein [Bacilli bacterium]MBR0075035.1 head-tail connector protein [Synergistaceae bacterium]